MRSLAGDRSDQELPIRIIIDTNVFISVEDRGTDDDAHSAQAAEFFRLTNELGIAIVVAFGTRSDLLRAMQATRLRREQQLEKYLVLKPVPPNQDLAKRAGFPENASANDLSDLDILNALHARAADWLVTQDFPLHKRAARAGFAERVFDLAEVISTLRFYLKKPTSMPGIQTVKGYEVDIASQIFGGLRAEYPGFDDWWQERVAREHRDVLMIGEPSRPEALSVVKPESTGEHALPEHTLKICTFKVADEFSGSRRGELLLKATIDYARRNRHKTVYVEVLPTKMYLMSWLESFGFRKLDGATTLRSEYIFMKQLYPDKRGEVLPPLDHNIRYGPGSVRVQTPHLVPIKPLYHSRLLPEAHVQLSLFAAMEAHGNAIGKAYLSHAGTRHLSPGDTLLFFLTGDGAAVTVIGVVESIHASREPQEIISFVGNRTVYSVEEIHQLCRSGEVLAIRFRLDRVLSPSWEKASLEKLDILRGNVQSIQRVRQGGIQWIADRLGEQR